MPSSGSIGNFLKVVFERTLLLITLFLCLSLEGARSYSDLNFALANLSLKLQSSTKFESHNCHDLKTTIESIFRLRKLENLIIYL